MPGPAPRGEGVGGTARGGDRDKGRKPAWEALELCILNSAGVQPAEKGRVWRPTLPYGLHEGSWGREGELSQLQETKCHFVVVGKKGP